MARGGFHGGSSHSGGHHSGGGGHHSSGGHYGGGGHYSGGSFFGGGSSRSGGGYSGGGSSYGGGGDNLIMFVCSVLAGGAFLILYLIVMIAEGNIPGMNLVNLGIFIASGVIFSLGLKEFDRTSDLNDLIKYKGEYVSGKVWKGNSIAYKKGDKLSWAGKYNYEYRISFYDPEFGKENARKVLETIDRTPRIIWINPFAWLVLGGVFFVSTFFFYECVIPHFERMKMTDLAFWFIDELVFYLPSILTLLCSIACLLIVKYKDRILYKCAERIVEDNTSSGEIAKTEEFITSRLSQKWYHNSCPNCGAPASFALRSCQSCGSSLEVKSFESEMPGAVHKVPVK